MAIPVLPWVERATRAAMWLAGVRTRLVPTRHGEAFIYEAPGSAGRPPLLLLHGIGAESSSYWPLLLGLRGSAGRVVAIDNLGHGQSACPEALSPDALVETVEDVMSLEFAEPAVVFGNSLGGAIALQLALRQPARVRSLVLVSPAGAPWTEAEIHDVRELFSISAASAVSFVHRLHARPIWYARAIARDVARRFQSAALRSLMDNMKPEMALTEAQARSLPARTLLLWGKQERILPNSSVSFFRAHLPGAVEEPEDWGHCPQLDRPFALVRRVRAWLAEEA